MGNLGTKNSDIRCRIMEYGKKNDDALLTDCCHSNVRGFVITFW